MSHLSPHWKNLSILAELDHLINESKYKPALIFKHDPYSSASNKVKKELDANWSLPLDQVDLFIVDASQRQIAEKISDIAEIDDETPQIVLFADGVTMYDESQDLISFKKIRLALKIVNRTFRWIETRS